MTAASTLQQLAKAYAEGELDTAGYRAARTKLLDAVALGEMIVEDLDFPPPVVPMQPGEELIGEGAPVKPLKQEGQAQAEAVTEIGLERRAVEGKLNYEAALEDIGAGEYGDLYSQPDQASQRAHSNHATNKGGNRRRSYSLVGGILLLIAALLYLYSPYQRDQAPPGEQAATDAATTAPAAEQAGNDNAIAADNAPPASNITVAASQVIDDFLNDKDWSEQRLEAFINQWRSLPDADRASVFGSGEYSQLVNAVYKRLLEEQAMSAIDPQAAEAKQKILVDFAERIGIQDSRIKAD